MLALNVYKKFIILIVKNIDFLLKLGYIIYAFVSTHVLQVLKNQEKRQIQWMIPDLPREKCKYSAR